MSSRLGTGPHGEPLAIVTVRTLPDIELGHRFVVLDMCRDLHWFTTRGRRPTPRERLEARPPYESKTKAATWESRTRRDQEDERLAEAEAIRLARLEQQREPVDLIGRAA